MTEFVFWKMAYDNGWATKLDIESAYNFNMITADQKKMILSEINES